jgi:hypothetical protein
VRQKIPTEIQSEKTVGIHISVSALNDVGIRCSPEVWDALTNGTKNIVVRLVSSNKEGTVIGGVGIGSNGTTGFCGRYIPDCHYLFYIQGDYRAKALVEITFPSAPPGITHADIIVCKSTSDFGP